MRLGVTLYVQVSGCCLNVCLIEGVGVVGMDLGVGEGCGHYTVGADVGV